MMGFDDIPVDPALMQLASAHEQGQGPQAVQQAISTVDVSAMTSTPGAQARPSPPIDPALTQPYASLSGSKTIHHVEAESDPYHLSAADHPVEGVLQAIAGDDAQVDKDHGIAHVYEHDIGEQADGDSDINPALREIVDSLKQAQEAQLRVCRVSP